MNIMLNESIVLCKYGKVFRGNKVRIAENNNVKAVLLYDDPYRGAPRDSNNAPNANIYPNGQYMPGTGTQRGSIFVEDGDPSTPSYPSIGEFNSNLF